MSVSCDWNVPPALQASATGLSRFHVAIVTLEC